MTTLDTKETLAALHRTNAIARLRKTALSTIDREARNASSLEALREAIERAIVEVATLERDAVSKA